MGRNVATRGRVLRSSSYPTNRHLSAPLGKALQCRGVKRGAAHFRCRFERSLSTRAFMAVAAVCCAVFLAAKVFLTGSAMA